MEIDLHAFSDHYIVWVTLRPLGSMRQGELSYVHYNIRQGEANLRTLKLTSVFHHLPRVGPKQLCALAHLECTLEAGNS